MCVALENIHVIYLKRELVKFSLCVCMFFKLETSSSFHFFEKHHFLFGNPAEKQQVKTFYHFNLVFYTSDFCQVWKHRLRLEVDLTEPGGQRSVLVLSMQHPRNIWTEFHYIWHQRPPVDGNNHEVVLTKT